MNNRMAKMMLVVLLLLASFSFPAQGTGNGAPGALIIDVRGRLEWELGHLDGAVLIPYDRIGEGIKAVTKSDKNTRIYLYCRSGRRTAIAAEILRKSGYGNLVDLGSMENASRVLGKKVVR